MQVVIADVVDVGRASPGVASRELVYHPLPATLVTCGPGCAFAAS
jgi:hypothetical protein